MKSINMEFIIMLQSIQYRLVKFLVCEISYYFEPCLVKFFTTLVVSMAVVIYKSINILKMFTVLHVTWAEDRMLSCQVKLQKENVTCFNMFKKKFKLSNSKMLLNTNSFLVVDCISVHCSGTLVCVLLRRIFLTNAAESFPVV